MHARVESLARGGFQFGGRGGHGHAQDAFNSGESAVDIRDGGIESLKPGVESGDLCVEGAPHQPDDGNRNARVR